MDETTRTELERLWDEDKRQNKRIEALEGITMEIQRLAISIHGLAKDMEQMLQEQKEQGERLSKLEQEPARKWVRMGDKVLDTAVGLLAGGAITGIIVMAVQYIK